MLGRTDKVICEGHFTSDLLEGRGAPKAIERYFKRFGF